MFVWISGSAGVGCRCRGRRSVFDYRDGYSEERWFRGGCCHRGTAVPGSRSFAHFRDWRVSSGRFKRTDTYLTISALQPCCAVTTEYSIPSDFVIISA